MILKKFFLVEYKRIFCLSDTISSISCVDSYNF